MTHVEPADGRSMETSTIRPITLNTTGSVYGASVQAGAVHGDVHVNVGRLTLPPPRQLPPASRRFANRRHELTQLDDVLACQFGTGPTVIVLSGLTGVGKTALALAALSRWSKRFSDGQLYADLTHPAEAAPAEMLGQFLRALGVPADQIPQAEAERAALWRTISAHRHLALLLEAPASSAQVRTLLPTSLHSLVVITSQRPLRGLVADGAHLISVESLGAEGSLEILGQHLGAELIAAHGHPARELAELCGGLPLALTVAAAHAAARPHRALSHTVATLRRAHNRLEFLSMHDDRSAQASFDTAYQSLSEPAATAYRALGLTPGQGFSAELAAAANDTDLDTAEDLLRELLDASLLTEFDADRYRFHDLVHEHARHAAEEHDLPEVRAATQERILRWYLHAARAAASTVMSARRELVYRFFSSSPPYFLPFDIEDYNTALTWLDRERRNLGAAVGEAATLGQPELAILLADAMQPLAIIHKDNGHTIAVDEIALIAAQATGDAAANTIRKRLARAYAGQGDIQRAQGHVDQALRDTSEAGDRRGYASALKSLALLHVATGNLEAAEDCFLEVVQILRDLGRSRAEGLALINLADALVQLDRAADATEHLERARILLSTLHKPDPYNAARADISLANARRHAGDHTAAEELAIRALAVMVRLDSRHQQANAHDVLVAIYEESGDNDLAERHRASAAALRSTSPGGDR